MTARQACQMACRYLTRARQAWATGTPYPEGAKHLDKVIGALRKVVEAKSTRKRKR